MNYAALESLIARQNSMENEIKELRKMIYETNKRIDETNKRIDDTKTSIIKKDC
ncbi:MAG: hypothetical protein ACPLZA_08020 [Thermodesulfovibrio sp.]|uniref:Uncharacterized protein n=1 Tax=Thermodesulfovibrio obliviosus TaxID=3118332 RepID=A0AAU8H5D5_9BACT